MTDATKTVLTEEEISLCDKVRRVHKFHGGTLQESHMLAIIGRLAARLALAEAVVDAAREAMPVGNRAWKIRLRAALAAYDAGTQ